MDVLNRVVFGCGDKAALFFQNAHIGIAGIYSVVIPVIRNVLTAHIINVIQKLVNNCHASVFVYIKACQYDIAFLVYRHTIYLVVLGSLYPDTRVNIARGLVEVVIFNIYVIGSI